MNKYYSRSNRQKYKTIQNLILSNIDINENNCWLWKKTTWMGYGKISWDGICWRVHRLAYLDFYGKLTKNLVLDHLCKNTFCVNPAHLEEISQKENVMRGNSLPCANSKKTHCSRGHEFVKENTLIYKNKRECKICKYERYKKYIKKKEDNTNIYSRM